MIMVGEESGALDDMMDEVADMYTREVDYELKTLSAQIEPILIVLLGVLVLILALGVFLPIWDLGRAAFGRVGLAAHARRRAGEIQSIRGLWHAAHREHAARLHACSSWSSASR